MKAVTSLTHSLGIFTKTYHYLQKSKAPDASIENLKLQWAKEVLSNLRVDQRVC